MCFSMVNANLGCVIGYDKSNINPIIDKSCCIITGILFRDFDSMQCHINFYPYYLIQLICCQSDEHFSRIFHFIMQHIILKENIPMLWQPHHLYLLFVVLKKIWFTFCIFYPNIHVFHKWEICILGSKYTIQVKQKFENKQLIIYYFILVKSTFIG